MGKTNSAVQCVIWERVCFHETSDTATGKLHQKDHTWAVEMVHGGLAWVQPLSFEQPDNIGLPSGQIELMIKEPESWDLHERVLPMSRSRALRM